MGKFSAEHRGHAIAYDPAADAFVAEGVQPMATLDALKRAIDRAIEDRSKKIVEAPIDDAPTVFHYVEALEAYVPGKAVAVDEKGFFLVRVPGCDEIFRERLNFERAAKSDLIGMALDPRKAEAFAKEHADAKALWKKLQASAGATDAERDALAGDRITFGDLLSVLPPFSPPEADASGMVTIDAFGWSARKGHKKSPNAQWEIMGELDRTWSINRYAWRLGEILGSFVALAAHKLPSPIHAVLEDGEKVMLTGTSTYRHVFAGLMTPLATELLKGGAEAEVAKATPLPGDGRPWPRPWHQEATRMTALNAAGEYRTAICGATYRRTPSALAITAEIGRRIERAKKAKEAFEAIAKAPPLMGGEDRRAIAAKLAPERDLKAAG